MAKPGFLGGNAAQNVQVVGGVRMFVQLTGSADWIDLGNAANIEVEPTAEFLEYSTNMEGVNAVVKRILTSRGLSVNMVLEEINLENLKFAFLGADFDQTKSINAIETAVVQIGSAGTGTLPEGALSILSYKQDDGTALGALVHTPGSANFSIISPFAANGSFVHMTYEPTDGTFPSATESAQSSEILDSSLISGSGQLRIRNTHGGLAQVYEFDQIEISPNGAIGVPAEEIQSLPVTMIAREVNGKFGRVYSKTIAAS